MKIGKVIIRVKLVHQTEKYLIYVTLISQRNISCRQPGREKKLGLKMTDMCSSISGIKNDSYGDLLIHKRHPYSDSRINSDTLILTSWNTGNILIRR